MPQSPTNTVTNSSYPNEFKNTQWTCSFSNVPTVGDYNDLKYYDSYVRSCIIPDYNSLTVPVDFKNSRINKHISRANDDLSQLQIEFAVSENFENYLNLFQFMQQLRYGQELTEDTLTENVIKRINITLLDNQNRPKGIIYFTNGIITALSSLSLIGGSSETLTFTVNLIYDEMKFENPV